MKVMFSKDAVNRLKESSQEVQRLVEAVSKRIEINTWESLIGSSFLKKVRVDTGEYDIWVVKFSDIRVFLVKAKVKDEEVVLVIDFTSM